MARRYVDLYPRVISFENLYMAWRAAAKGKRRKGPVAAFEFRLEENLFELERELAERSYRPEGYRSFYIFDPKRRLISAAPFRDRVVHHALCRIIEPIFERTFIGDSYANRKGKGVHAALDRAQGFAKRYPMVLQCDIRQFFPSIDYRVLYDIHTRKIDDKCLLWLVRTILMGGHGVLSEEYDLVRFPGDDLLAAARPRGLPIGNLTSQFWANVYLNELDQFVKRQLGCKGYVRYVDDFLLFSDDKRELWEWKRRIIEFLARLRLTLHLRESTVYPVTNGVPFLGLRVYPDHRRVKRRNVNLFLRRLARYRRAVERGDMELSELSRRVRGWVAHVEHADSWRLRESLFDRNRIHPRRSRRLLHEAVADLHQDL